MMEASYMLISVVVPCYNEETVLPIFYKEFNKIKKELHGVELELLIVDDGSKDDTRKVILSLAANDSIVKYISFSRNFGKEAAIYAGLQTANGDFVAVIDADLQDPISLLPGMYSAVASGEYASAATRRVTRKGEPKIRSFFARLFYKLMHKISKVDLVDGERDRIHKGFGKDINPESAYQSVNIDNFKQAQQQAQEQTQQQPQQEQRASTPLDNLESPMPEEPVGTVNGKKVNVKKFGKQNITDKQPYFNPHMNLSDTAIQKMKDLKAKQEKQQTQKKGLAKDLTKLDKKTFNNLLKDYMFKDPKSKEYKAVMAEAERRGMLPKAKPIVEQKPVKAQKETKQETSQKVSTEKQVPTTTTQQSGTIKEGTKMATKPTIQKEEQVNGETKEPKGTQHIQESSAEIQKRPTNSINNQQNGERRVGQKELGNDTRTNERLLLNPKETKLYKTSKARITLVDMSNDKQEFSVLLNTLKKQNKYGDYVDGHNVEDLEEKQAICFSNKTKQVTCAVEKNGNICCACKGKSNIKGAAGQIIYAALYAVLTLSLAPLSYGPIQVRVSEFMTLLAFTNRKCIPGLVLGCFLANIGSPYGVTDMVVGTLATFLALYAMQFCPNLFVASLMPVLFNGVIIGAELAYLAALPEGVSMAATMLYIGAGEFVSVSVLGIIIFKLLLKNHAVREYLANYD
jgi:uncharacterized membrane protein